MNVDFDEYYAHLFSDSLIPSPDQLTPPVSKIKGLRTYNFDSPPRSRPCCRTRLLVVGLILAVVILSTLLFVGTFRVKEDLVVPRVPSWKIRPPLQSPTRDLRTIKVLHNDSENFATNFSCSNTIQGKRLLTDSFGSVCLRENIMVGGCCHPSRRLGKLDCKTCRQDLGCCESFEYCVSCCLAQRQELGKARNETYLPPHSSPFSRLVDRGNNRKAKEESSHVDAGFSLDDFDRCLHLCRTSSRSVQHGNEYKSSLKHCYHEIIDYTETPLLTLSELTTVFVARLGMSCHDACNEEKGICSEESLQAANDCSELQKYFPCQQCLPSPPSLMDGARPVAPGFLSGTVNGIPPESCLVHADISFIDCKASHPSIKRLCVCLPK